MINKNQYRKINDKKVLHKVGKSWKVISLALLMAIGGVASAKTVTANADATTTNNNKNQVSNTNTLKERLNSSLQKTTPTQNSNNVSTNNIQRNNATANVQQNANQQNITNQANALHERILKNAVGNSTPKANTNNFASNNSSINNTVASAKSNINNSAVGAKTSINNSANSNFASNFKAPKLSTMMKAPQTKVGGDSGGLESESTESFSDVPVTLKFVNGPDATNGLANKVQSDGNGNSMIRTGLLNVSGQAGHNVSMTGLGTGSNGTPTTNFANTGVSDVSDYQLSTDTKNMLGNFQLALSNGSYQWNPVTTNKSSDNYSDSDNVLKGGHFANWDNTNNRPMLVFVAKDAQPITVDYTNESGKTVTNSTVGNKNDSENLGASDTETLDGHGRLGDGVDVWSTPNIPDNTDYSIDSDTTKQNYNFLNSDQDVTVPLSGKTISESNNGNNDNQLNKLTVHFQVKDHNGTLHKGSSDASLNLPDKVLYLGGQIGNDVHLTPQDFLTNEFYDQSSLKQNSDASVYMSALQNYVNDPSNQNQVSDFYFQGRGNGTGEIGHIDPATNIFTPQHDITLTFDESNNYSNNAKPLKVTYINQDGTHLGTSTINVTPSDYHTEINVTDPNDRLKSGSTGVGIPAGYQLTSGQQTNFTVNSDEQDIPLYVHGLQHTSSDSYPFTVDIKEQLYTPSGQVSHKNTDGWSNGTKISKVYPHLTGYVGDSAVIGANQYTPREEGNYVNPVNASYDINFGVNGITSNEPNQPANTVTFNYNVYPQTATAHKNIIHYVSYDDVKNGAYDNYIHSKGDQPFFTTESDAGDPTSSTDMSNGGFSDKYYRENVPTGYQFLRVLNVNGHDTRNTNTNGLQGFGSSDQEETIEVIPNAQSMVFNYINQNNQTVKTVQDSANYDTPQIAVNGEQGHTSKYGHTVSNGKIDRESTAYGQYNGQLGVPYGYHISQETQSPTFKTSPQTTNVMIAGNEDNDNHLPVSRNRNANVTIHEEDANHHIINTYTVNDKIAGRVGDNYTINSSDFTPDGYSFDGSYGHKKSYTGLITPNDITVHHADFYYMADTDNNVNDLKPINVIFRDASKRDHNQVGTNLLLPENGQRSGENVDVTKQNGFTVPSPYQLAPEQNTNVTMSTTRNPQITLNVYDPAKEYMGIVHINQNVYKQGKLMNSFHTNEVVSGPAGTNYSYNPANFEMNGYEETPSDSTQKGQLTKTGLTNGNITWNYNVEHSAHDQPNPNYNPKVNNPSDIPNPNYNPAKPVDNNKNVPNPNYNPAKPSDNNKNIPNPSFNPNKPSDNRKNINNPNYNPSKPSDNNKIAQNPNYNPGKPTNSDVVPNPGYNPSKPVSPSNPKNKPSNPSQYNPKNIINPNYDPSKPSDNVPNVPNPSYNPSKPVSPSNEPNKPNPSYNPKNEPNHNYNPKIIPNPGYNPNNIPNPNYNPKNIPNNNYNPKNIPNPNYNPNIPKNVPNPKYNPNKPENNTPFNPAGTKPSNPHKPGKIGANTSIAQPIYVQYYTVNPANGVQTANGSDVRVDGFLNQNFSDITKQANVPLGYHMDGPQNVNYSIGTQEQQVDLYVEQNSENATQHIHAYLENPDGTINNLNHPISDVSSLSNGEAHVFSPSDFNPDNTDFINDTSNNRDSDITAINSNGTLTDNNANGNTGSNIINFYYRLTKPNSDINAQPIHVRYYNKRGEYLGGGDATGSYNQDISDVTKQVPLPNHYNNLGRNSITHYPNNLLPNQNLNYRITQNPQDADFILKGDTFNGSFNVNWTEINSDGTHQQGSEPYHGTFTYGSDFTVTPDEENPDSALYHTISNDSSDVPDTIYVDKNGQFNPNGIHYSYAQNPQGSDASYLQVNYIDHYSDGHGHSDTATVGQQLINGKKKGFNIPSVASDTNDGVQAPRGYSIMSDVHNKKHTNYTFSTNPGTVDVDVNGKPENNANDHDKDMLTVHRIMVNRDGTESTDELYPNLSDNVSNIKVISASDYTPNGYSDASSDIPANVRFNSDGSINPDAVTFVYNQTPTGNAKDIILHYYNQAGKQVGTTDDISGQDENGQTIDVTNGNVLANGSAGETVPQGYDLVPGQQTRYTFNDEVNQNVNLVVVGKPIKPSDNSAKNQLSVKIYENGVYKQTKHEFVNTKLKDGLRVGDTYTVNPNEFTPNGYFVSPGHGMSDSAQNISVNPDFSITPRQVSFNYGTIKNAAAPLKVIYLNQHGHQVGYTDMITGNVGSDVNVTNPATGGEAIPDGYDLKGGTKQGPNARVNVIGKSQDTAYKLTKHRHTVYLRVKGIPESAPLNVYVVKTDSLGHTSISDHPTMEHGNDGDLVEVNPSSYTPNGYKEDYDRDSTQYATINGNQMNPSKIMFYYDSNTKKGAPIVVRYINQKTGQPVGYADTITGNQGDTVNVTDQAQGGEAIPKGFSLINNPQVNYTFSNSPQIVNLDVQGDNEGTQQFTVRVIKEDQQGNIIGSPTNVQLNISDDVGNSFKVSPYNFDKNGAIQDVVENGVTGARYTMPSGFHAVASDADQQINVNSDGQLTPENSTTYVYQQNYTPQQIGTVRIHYVDASDNTFNQISSSNGNVDPSTGKLTGALANDEVDEVSDRGIVNKDTFNFKPYTDDIPETLSQDYSVPASPDTRDSKGNAITPDKFNWGFSENENDFKNGVKDVYVRVNKTNGPIIL